MTKVNPIDKMLWPDFYDLKHAPTKKKRRCLLCGEYFMSSDNGLRYCNRCGSLKHKNLMRQK